jgi:hypothetical protein
MQMDKDKILDEIFSNDPFGLLNVKPSSAPARTADERLVASFQALNDFYEANKREPQLGGGVQEHMLYSRLKSIREDAIKSESLKPYDTHGLLNYVKKEFNSLDDILNDDSLDLLKSEDEGLFEFKHVKSQKDREEAEFVARRKPCKNFDKYEQKFKDVHTDLKLGKRQLVKFNEQNMQENTYYILNGMLVYLETIYDFKKDKNSKLDGRIYCVFENGTESQMRYRSLGKGLYENGFAVTHSSDSDEKVLAQNASAITDEDEEAGYIYILNSKSTHSEIQNINHLYKIGYSEIEVEERIKNAAKEPTYLMAEVGIVSVFKCYNMNPQKLEKLLHNFFGNSCLSIDVTDSKGMRHTPREWFIAPIDVITETIHLIISGEILKYRYDIDNKVIVLK